MRKTKFLFGVILSTAFIFQSCSKEKFQAVDDTNLSENMYSTDGVLDGMMKLGKKLENPYSVDNMKKAWANLKSKNSIAYSNKEGINISTTHFYLRFKPKNEEELSALKYDSTLILYSYPLDYEITVPGVFYHDPDIPIDKPTYQYCAVKADKVLPKEIEYEILAELFIPDENLDENKDKTARVASPEIIDALVDEALRITGNLENETTSNRRIKSSSWRPAGRIQLFDDQLGRLVGVHGAKVQARRWFTTYEGITDVNGNFSCNGTFKRDANYSIPWERYDYDIRSGSLGQALYNGPKMTGNWNLEIRDGVSRMYAIVHQACHDYFYGNRLGLKSPPQNSFWKTALKISVWDEPNKDGNASHC